MLPEMTLFSWNCRLSCCLVHLKVKKSRTVRPHCLRTSAYLDRYVPFDLSAPSESFEVFYAPDAVSLANLWTVLTDDAGGDPILSDLLLCVQWTGLQALPVVDLVGAVLAEVGRAVDDRSLLLTAARGDAEPVIELKRRLSSTVIMAISCVQDATQRESLPPKACLDSL